ncbi:MAG: hypothetical protein R3B40_21025 [Polyangiales bacterium]|nr:hypothetical protein [Myxococcales bacterium]MCB9658431.1 hypothetical protein [Sandaracinaceae bacterium]
MEAPTSATARYDTIGQGYGRMRRADPAIMTVHHWDEGLWAGLGELARVARERVVILTLDARVSSGLWLLRDYLPELAELEARIFPALEDLAARLGGRTAVEVVPLSRDTPDGMLVSFWGTPAAVLDPARRAATSGFARLPPAVVDRAVCALRDDLASGAWDARNGALRTQAAWDVGLRLVVSELAGAPDER